jgi:hypothetical protein
MASWDSQEYMVPSQLGSVTSWSERFSFLVYFLGNLIVQRAVDEKTAELEFLGRLFPLGRLPHSCPLPVHQHILQYRSTSSFVFYVFLFLIFLSF